MCKMLVAEALKNMYQYIKCTALSILLIVLVSSYQTCITEQSYHEQAGDLVMDVTSREDKHIQVHIGLKAGINEVILSNYRLRIRIIAPEEGTNTIFIHYINKLGQHERAITVDQPLSYFTIQERINVESEEFNLPFSFIPGVGVTHARICFELLNEIGTLINSANVLWKHASIASEKPLKVSEEVVLPIVEILDSPVVSKVDSENKFTLKLSEHTQIETGVALEDKKPAVSYLSHAKGKEQFKEVEKVKRNNVQLEGEKLVMPAAYTSMSEQELTKRANKNDVYAQELIARKVMAEGPFVSLLKIATPYCWYGIEEKVQKDGRYIYLLLINPSQIKDNTICKLFVDRVLKQAQEGDPLAQTNLGMMYLAGKGVLRNNKQALKCFIRATEQNFGLAYYMLGQVYRHGIGIKKSIKEAIKWHLKAFDQGMIRSKCSLTTLYIDRLLIDQCENGEELVNDTKEEHKRGIEWLVNMAGKEGDKNAQAALGLMYCMGKGVEQNIKLGMEWVNMATEYKESYLLSNNYLINAIGDLYYDGMFGIPVDYEKAIELYRKAAQSGMMAAQKNLAKMYLKGKGTEQDLIQAAFWGLQAKDRVWLLDKFGTDFNHASKYSKAKEKEELKRLGKELIDSCRYMRATEKQSTTERHADMLPNLFQGLEEIVAEFMKWQQQLNAQSGLLINCIHFQDARFKDITYESQAEVGCVAYIKMHVYREKNYISFGEANVQLAEKILQEQAYRTHRNEALNLLRIITAIYKKARVKASCKAKEIPELLLKLNTNQKLRKKILLKELKRNKTLTELFVDKVVLLEHMEKQFSNFYRSLFEQIEEILAFGKELKE